MLQVSDKLKRKQASLVQLQEEKETMYSDLSGRLGDVTSSKEREFVALTEENRRLQAEVDAAKQVRRPAASCSPTRTTPLFALCQKAPNYISGVEVKARA